MYQVCEKRSARQGFFIPLLLIFVMLLFAACASHELVAENPKTLFQEAEKRIRVRVMVVQMSFFR